METDVLRLFVCPGCGLHCLSLPEGQWGCVPCNRAYVRTNRVHIIDEADGSTITEIELSTSTDVRVEPIVEEGKGPEEWRYRIIE